MSEAMMPTLIFCCHYISDRMHATWCSRSSSVRLTAMSCEISLEGGLSGALLIIGFSGSLMTMVTGMRVRAHPPRMPAWDLDRSREGAVRTLTLIVDLTAEFENGSHSC